jgi:hypothetical protein
VEAVVGVADKVKSGAGMTTRSTTAVCVVAPLLPVMVSRYVAAASDAALVTESVEVPDAVTLGGLKLQLAWEVVRPESESATGSAKPFTGPMPIVYETLPPGKALADAGEAAIVKSGGGDTCTTAVAVRVLEPLVPEIDSG